MGREKIREYAGAIGSSAPVHFDPEAAHAAGFGAVVAPSTFAAVYVAPPLAGALFDPEVGVFDPEVGLAGYRFVQRGQRWEWGAPVCSGDVITTEASLAAGEQREGAVYRTFASISHNQRGEVVLRGTYEGVVPATARAGGEEGAGRKGDEGKAGAVNGGERMAGAVKGDDDRASPEPGPEWDGAWPPPAGRILPEFNFTPDKYAPIRYAGASGDFTPFHLDPDLARAVGLDGVILHGLYTFAQLARGILAPLGEDPRALRSLAARFRRPAFPERELTVSGRFETTSADAARVGCEVSQGGKQVLSHGVAELVRPRPEAK